MEALAFYSGVHQRISYYLAYKTCITTLLTFPLIAGSNPAAAAFLYSFKKQRSSVAISVLNETSTYNRILSILGDEHTNIPI